jgi:hypothetical protein
MDYLKALFSDWLLRMSSIITLSAIGMQIALILGYDLHIPRWIPLPVAIVTLVFSSYRIWHKERLRAEAGQKLRDGLRTKCDTISLEWEKLAEQYQRAKKDILPNPMDPGWAGYQLEFPWPYKVGVLQGQTNALREDLVRVGIEVEEWDYAYMAMPQLLHALKNYERKVNGSNDSAGPH